MGNFGRQQRGRARWKFLPSIVCPDRAGAFQADIDMSETRIMPYHPIALPRRGHTHSEQTEGFQRRTFPIGNSPLSRVRTVSDRFGHGEDCLEHRF